MLALTVGADNAVAQALYRKLGYVRTAEPPRRVHGTVQLRTGPLEVDDVLLPFEKRSDGRLSRSLPEHPAVPLRVLGGVDAKAGPWLLGLAQDRRAGGARCS